jgi:hypothetical protein
MSNIKEEYNRFCFKGKQNHTRQSFAKTPFAKTPSVNKNEGYSYQQNQPKNMPYLNLNQSYKKESYDDLQKDYSMFDYQPVEYEKRVVGLEGV